MKIRREIDIEDEVRRVLAEYMTAYCRPLPKNFKTPSVLIQQVGGNDQKTIDHIDIVLDSRAETEAEAFEQLRTAVGILRAAVSLKTNKLSYVSVNSLGSWGIDPVRPELAMCSARLSVIAHEEITEV